MSTDSATNDTKGCVGCVIVVLLLGAAGYYYGPGVLAWDKQRRHTNTVGGHTWKALDRVPEFLAARRLKGELLAKIRDALETLEPWDAPASMREPPPKGSLAGRVILWQQHRRTAPADAPVMNFEWQFDLEIDISVPVSKALPNTPATRRTLPHADEIRQRIESALPPTLRLAPGEFTLIHQDGDVRPGLLERVFLPKDASPLVRALFQGRGLADPEAKLPEIRFAVVRAIASKSRVGSYTDGVSADRGTIEGAFFLVPSNVCIGTHKTTWNPPRTKTGRYGFNAPRAARSRFDTWLQSTHGFAKPLETFFPEMSPPPVAKKPVTRRKTRRR